MPRNNLFNIYIIENTMNNKSVMSDDKDDLNQLVIPLSTERGRPASRAKELKLADAASDLILHR